MAQNINKDALAAWIKEKKIPFKKDIDDGVYPTYLYALMDFEDFIDTLEVKEVDLEKEIDDYINKHFSECDDGVLISDANSTELTLLDAASIARYFFELGLKAKGE